MKTRTSIVLAVLALGLVTFIFGYERGCATTEDRQDRSDRVLPDFNRDSVDRVVLGTGEERIELERVRSDGPDAGGLGSVGRWRILRPLQVEADQEAVDNLLSSIDWLERRRTVEEDGAAGREQFGLAEPRATVAFRLRGREVTLRLGADAPGESIYLAIGGEDDRVIVVDREFLEDVTREVGELRDKRLARLRVPTTAAVRVSGRFHAVRQGPLRWSLETPVRMRADTVAVEGVVRSLEALRATRFVADDLEADGLARFGLAAPRREVTVRVEGEREPVVLRFGERCEGHADEVYATVVGSGTVACVRAEDLDELEADPARLRDMRATRLRISALDGITIVRGGQELALERQGETWRFGGEQPTAADAEAVEDFLEALREASAESVETDLDRTGLAGEEPRADAEVRLRLAEEEGAGAEVLRFAIGEERVLLRRGDEAVALVLPASLAEALDPTATRYRDRQLVDERAAEAVEIEVTAPGLRQVLRKPERSWRVVEPVEHRADDTVVGEVVRSLAQLRAERFVAASPAAEHGLRRPSVTVRIRFEGAGAPGPDAGQADAGRSAPRDHTVHFGAEAPGGVYARLEGAGQPVFVVEGSLAERLSRPLVDRDLFAFAEDAVRGLTIERGAERFELALEDGAWRSAEGEAEPGAVERVLSRLAVVRAAEAVSYGPPPRESGFDPPRARVLIRLEDEDEQTPEELVVLLGAEYRAGDEARVYARRDGVEVTLGLPARSAEPVLRYGAE